MSELKPTQYQLRQLERCKQFGHDMPGSYLGERACMRCGAVGQELMNVEPSWQAPQGIYNTPNRSVSNGQ